jgi:hypothetical protein
MTWTFTGRVRGSIRFPDHPHHVGEWGLVGGEDVWVVRSTFRSSTEAARWCERILRGETSRPRWTTDGPILQPHTEPGWSTAEVTASSDDDQHDDITFRWNGEGWEERGHD